MKLKYHGYNGPRSCLSFREWLFRSWHDVWPRGYSVVEERGIQILGCYAIWQRVGKD